MRNLTISSALLMAALCSAAEEKPYEPDEHTVLLLHMDQDKGEVTADASVSGLEVTLLPAPRRPTWEEHGMFNGCLRFDGVNADEDGDGKGDADALWFKDQGKLEPGEGLTVEAWIKPERVDRSQGILTRAGGGRYGFFIYGKSLYFSMQVTRDGQSDWERIRVNNVIAAGRWQHVAASYDGEKVRAYVNGLQVGEAAATGTPTTGEAVTVIGSDTDSRPLDSAIRGFKGLIDEVRVSNIARTEFNVAEERKSEVAAEIAQAAPTPALPDRPKYPDPPLPPVNERHVTATGRVLDDAGRPLPGVLVSDGEHVVSADEQGVYRLEFDLKDLRFVFATRPRAFKPVGSWYLPVKRDDTATEYQQDFVFAPDALADRDEFSFLTSGDTQFNDLGTFAHLLDEYDQLTQMSGQPAFFTIAGDLTMVGTQWEMDLYKEVSARSHLYVYDCFGGHDGNYAREQTGRGSIYNYQKNLGPAWYSWDYGPVHFALYVSETSFITERQQQLQSAWLEADLAAQPPGKPIILETHIPPPNEIMQGWLDKHNIIALVYGHWHLINVCGYKRVPYIDTSPMRGRDWGAFARSFRIVSYADEKVSTEMRVCGQAQRLDLVAPQGRVSRGQVPVQVKAYDTVRRVTEVTCEIESGGRSVQVPLEQTGAWTWEGSWDSAGAPAGEFQVTARATDEDGRAWERAAKVMLTDGLRTQVRLGDDWPGFFRQQHSRVREEPLAPPLELAWAVNTGGRYQKAVSPIIYNGKLYVGVDHKDVGHPGAGVSCYDPANGQLLWHRSTDSSVCFAPAAADGVIYAVTSLGTCYALDAESGAVKWGSQPFGVPSSHRLVQCCPVIEGDELILAADGGNCAVLDRATGETRRDFSMGGSLIHFSFPSVREGRVYGGIRKKAVAHDLVSGEQIWETEISTGKISSTPVPHRGRLYINAATLSCLNEATGEKLWDQPVPTSGNGISAAVPAGDLVLATGSVLRAFDADSGEPRWQHEFVYDAETAKANQRQTYAGQSTPLAAGDVVYVGSDDGHLYAFALEDGEPLWRCNLGVPLKGSPALSGNALFICDWDGNLYCFVGA